MRYQEFSLGPGRVKLRLCTCCLSLSLDDRTPEVSGGGWRKVPSWDEARGTEKHEGGRPFVGEGWVLASKGTSLMG